MEGEKREEKEGRKEGMIRAIKYLENLRHVVLPSVRSNLVNSGWNVDVSVYFTWHTDIFVRVYGLKENDIFDSLLNWI